MKGIFGLFRMGWNEPWYAGLSQEGGEAGGAQPRNGAHKGRLQRTFRFVQSLSIAQRMSLMLVAMLSIIYILSTLRTLIFGPPMQRSINSMTVKVTIARQLSTSPARPISPAAVRLPALSGAARQTGNCPNGVEKALMPSRDVLVVVCNGGSVLTTRLR